MGLRKWWWLRWRLTVNLIIRPKPLVLLLFSGGCANSGTANALHLKSCSPSTRWSSQLQSLLVQLECKPTITTYQNTGISTEKRQHTINTHTPRLSTSPLNRIMLLNRISCTQILIRSPNTFYKTAITAPQKQLLLMYIPQSLYWTPYSSKCWS